MTTKTNRTIVLLGKVGHGKTRILNQLCGTRFPSSMGATSCTRELQYGRSKRWDLNVVDTPGFYSSEEIDLHTEAQRKALEDEVVSGIYAVIKYSSSSDIAEVANRLMDFAGEDDIRIIVTHADTTDALMTADLKTELHRLLDVAVCNIAVVGKESDATELEGFVFSTLHTPRHLRVPQVQIAAVAALSVGARQFNKEIEELPNILLDAERAFKFYYGMQDCDAKKLSRNILFHESLSQVNSSRRAIEKNAKGLLPEEQKIVLDKIKDVIDPAVSKFKSEHNPSNRKRRGVSSVRVEQDPRDFQQALYVFLLSYSSSTAPSPHEARATDRSSSDEDSFGSESKFDRSRKYRSIDRSFDCGKLKSALDDERHESLNLNASVDSSGMDQSLKPSPGHSISDDSLSYYNKAGGEGNSSIFDEIAKRPACSTENSKTPDAKSQVTESTPVKKVTSPSLSTSKHDKNPSTIPTERRKMPDTNAKVGIGAPRLTQQLESPDYRNMTKETTGHLRHQSTMNQRTQYSDVLRGSHSSNSSSQSPCISRSGCQAPAQGTAGSVCNAHLATSSTPFANSIGGGRHRESYELNEEQQIQSRNFPSTFPSATDQTYRRRSTPCQNGSRNSGWPATGSTPPKYGD